MSETHDTELTEAQRIAFEAHERLAERSDLTMIGTEEIAMVLYPGFTALDFVGPQYFLGSLMGATVHVASIEPAGSHITSDTGVSLVTTVSLDDVARCDVLFVPGSGGGLIGAMTNTTLLGHLGRLAASAAIVASVCTGSLVLGAAGLLSGRHVTSHWVMRDLLARFGAVRVDERVVRDGNLWTAAGVTAGIDLGLAIAEHLRGPGYRVALELLAELSTPNAAGNDEIEGAVHAMFAETTLRAERVAT